MRRLLRPLTRLTRLAALLVWVAQLGIAAAPAADGRAGPSAAPHAEAYGTRVHYAHTPELCPACAAYALLGQSELVARSARVEAPLARTAPVAVEWVSVTRRLTAAQPRGPPA
jgi:hypothetical protein